MKTKLLTVCFLLFTSQAFAIDVDTNIKKLISLNSCNNCKLVEVTGGEPLMQKECIDLLEKLESEKYQILLETGGSLPVNKVPKSVVKIIDFKCPGSGMAKKNLWSILNDIQSTDEIKFVIKDKADFVWAEQKVMKYKLDKTNPVIFSPVFNELKYEQLAEWVKDSKLKIRMQIQLHKHIWSPEMIGV